MGLKTGVGAPPGTTMGLGAGMPMGFGTPTGTGVGGTPVGALGMPKGAGPSGAGAAAGRPTGAVGSEPLAGACCLFSTIDSSYFLAFRTARMCAGGGVVSD